MGKMKSMGTGLAVMGLLAALAMGSILMPKKQVSQKENRMLERFPSFSMTALLDGSLGGKLMDYASDHILLRDSWLDAAGVLDTRVLQKVERKDILLGREGRMFPKVFGTAAADMAQFEKNISTVAQFAQRYGADMTFLLVPSADLICAEQMPLGAPQEDEAAALDWAFRKVGKICNVLDLREAFGADPQKLYYNTDHHWTTDGAYLAYQSLCQMQGMEAVMPDPALRREVPGFEGTHAQSARWPGAGEDTLVYYDLPNMLTSYRVDGEFQLTPTGEKPLVNTQKLEQVDKYGAFLDGNDGYLEIGGNGSGSILVIKDSYANCFVPFLVENFGTIGVMDLRNYPYSPDTIIREKGYQQILVLYSFHNFREDHHLIYLNRPSTIQ